MNRQLFQLFLMVLLLICFPLCAINEVLALTGVVVDVQGRPVSEAVLCSQWGPPKAAAVALPLGPSVMTDAAGHFSLPSSLIMSSRLALLVYNSTNTQGALVDMAITDAVQPLTIRLQPLHAVRYLLRVPVPIGANENTAHIWTQSGEVVGSVLGIKGTLMLPPGKYELKTGVDDTDRASQPFTVAGTDVTLEPLQLALSPMAQHYGHGTPTVSTLRDMNRQLLDIGSLQGHWTLLYFWADWCLPCIREGMPKLIAFATAHNAARDKFRIVAIHENQLTEDGDWSDFYTKTTKLEKEVWHSVPPFPIAYDETTRMTSDWGVHQFPTYALINPAGNLVRGGSLSMLETELDKQ